MDLKKVDAIIDRYSAERGVLIQLLLDMQNEFNWIPKEAIVRVNERLQIPISEIYRVASFYKAMSLTPVGRHMVQVCLGTACHVRGGTRILEEAEDILGIKAGETTQDMSFSLRRVNCLGCCALGPIMVLDGEYHGKITPTNVRQVLQTTREREYAAAELAR